eukprot:363671-Chlamydomonas_euryale.AAC.8
MGLSTSTPLVHVNVAAGGSGEASSRAAGTMPHVASGDAGARTRQRASPPAANRSSAKVSPSGAFDDLRCEAVCWDLGREQRGRAVIDAPLDESLPTPQEGPHVRGLLSSSSSELTHARMAVGASSSVRCRHLHQRLGPTQELRGAQRAGWHYYPMPEGSTCASGHAYASSHGPGPSPAAAVPTLRPHGW